MKISRRNFIRIGVYSTIAVATAYPILIESEWIDVKEIKLSDANRERTIIHITDLHYKGDGSYLECVVRKINAISPKFVCFTGDTVEDAHYLNEALDFMTKIKCPIYGVPGNHDHWSNAPFNVMKAAFGRTGGDWLVNERVRIPEENIEIIGIDGFSQDYFTKNRFDETDGAKRILLVHYPKMADELSYLKQKFDLILAGHSHGGQVRVPFLGPLILPPGVGNYDKGLFHTPAGPLYVNPGIGTYAFPVRFNCRPEITVIRL
ncbi:MAG: hypothetical protein A3G34_10540 [Candidatus Lindowbacteria bacterium RIFCSPLOWO2_12_FULL_62_27]|nr:MAG: hypothetical protein A3G34_10540 [Candidatus Lindowbacteria bacterium RIFCSPLOWO2_12_FULL_62_27]